MKTTTEIITALNGRGITPPQIADAIGVSRASITRWKKGSNPKPKHLERLRSYYLLRTSTDFYALVQSYCSMGDDPIEKGMAIIHLAHQFGGCVNCLNSRALDNLPPDLQSRRSDIKMRGCIHGLSQTDCDMLFEITTLL
jgi:transcriptional regulator with XRE-family HTH domain